MNRYKMSAVGWLLSLIFASAPAQDDNQTRVFAAARAERIADVAYELFFDLEKGQPHYGGKAVIHFLLKQATEPLVIDFTGKSVESIDFNGKPIDSFTFSPRAGRITIPADALEDGPTNVTIVFTGAFSHSGSGFHQFIDPADGLEYLYTDFQPNDAHRMFPCFDQPDLKATYQLEVLAPADWQVIGNSPVVRQKYDKQRQRSRFMETKKFSTYLFHLSAGPYAFWRDPSFRVPLGLYCRQSLAAHLDPERMFEVTRKSFDFFESYFGMPYPFEKYDQIFVPEFNAGAMENVGAVTFTEFFIFRSEPTRSRLLRRDTVVFHEMAHMWFGNLVTMKWWDDLWLNESFASYAAYLAQEATGVSDIWTRISRRRSNVFIADQRVTTHPIVADVPDIRAASNIFDNITYGKGLAVLRQLDHYLGGDVFREGLRYYFQKNAWGNTTLADFIDALEHVAKRDLDTWVRQWLLTADVNTLQIEYQVVEGKLQNVHAIQSPGIHNEVLRAHAADVGLYDLDAVGKPYLKEKVKIRYDGARYPLPELNDKPAPVMLLPNLSDVDYVKVALDDRSLKWIQANIHLIEDHETKASLWRVLWGMVQDRKMPPQAYLHMALEQAGREHSVEILDQLFPNLKKMVGSHIPNTEERNAYRSRLHQLAREKLSLEAAGSDRQKKWYDLLVDTAVTPTELNTLVAIFEGKMHFAGLTIDNRRKWDILGTLAKWDHPGIEEMVQSLSERDPSAYGKNFRLYLTALKPDPAAKQAAWQTLLSGQDHSLRELVAIARGFFDEDQEHLAKPYVKKFFEHLPEVYRTRKWEFVSRFANYLFPYQGYEETLGEAEAFLKRGDLDTTLRNLVLEQVDDLQRDLKIRELWRSTGSI